MTAKPFHLGWFLADSKVQDWRGAWSGNVAQSWMSPELYVDIARDLERAGFDYILLEDNVYIPDRYGDSMEIYLRNCLSTPRQDPAVLAPIIAAATKRIGIVATLSTFAYHPYLLARQIGTLDQVSGGRAGWNMVTGSSQRAYQNFGYEDMTEHDLRYEMASEFMNLTNALWDSWEPDAIVADAQGGVFADHTKVHRVDFTGEYYAARGALNSGPLPQGRAVIAQAGSSPRGREFAATYADTVVGDSGSITRMKEYRTDLRNRMEAIGRKPDECKILFLIAPVLGDTDEEAREKAERHARRNADRAEETLAILSKMTDIDFGAFPLDEPIGDQEWKTNGTQATLDDFIARNKGKTLREAGGQAWKSDIALVGSPDTVAAGMNEMMEEVGGDGFLIARPDVNRKTMAEFTDGLIPALQRRGLVRTSYTHEQFRSNLLEF